MDHMILPLSPAFRTSPVHQSLSLLLAPLREHSSSGALLTRPLRGPAWTERKCRVSRTPRAGSGCETLRRGEICPRPKWQVPCRPSGRPSPAPLRRAECASPKTLSSRACDTSSCSSYPRGAGIWRSRPSPVPHKTLRHRPWTAFRSLPSWTSFWGVCPRRQTLCVCVDGQSLLFHARNKSLVLLTSALEIERAAAGVADDATLTVTVGGRWPLKN
mmetsp:Transcript_4580/g.7940  ORF Transcript_4580/g.7940 Transcript_4580/m.7940 type:complete len:216 (-) Transcript_4580:50-697(-)